MKYTLIAALALALLASPIEGTLPVEYHETPQEQAGSDGAFWNVPSSSVVLGYMQRCANGNEALAAYRMMNDRGIMLSNRPHKSSTIEALKAACQETTTQTCQITAERDVWDHMSRLLIDAQQKPTVGVFWNAALQYGYDLPPVIDIARHRLIPIHMLSPSVQFMGAYTELTTKSGVTVRINDDGGVAPLRTFIMQARCWDSVAVAPWVSHAPEYEDPKHTTFRPSSQMAERRIVAVGDLHGDMESALSVLRMAGVIHQNNSWAGGNHTILVQTGDLIDRGPDTVQLLNLFPRLVQEANKAGGRVIQILGNHEFMNMLGDLSFVRERSSEFASRQSRKIAFSPSGDIGRRLFNLPIMHQIGDTVFTHGGILPAWASSIVHRVNAYATQHLMAYFAGALEELPAVFGPDGPTWYRGYALGAEKTICSVLQSALNAMGAKRMVVGHTMQDNGRILSRCDKRFFVIDVGISKAMLGYQAALEILPNGSVRGIYPSGVQELSESVDTDIDDKRPTAANSGERKRKSGE